MKMVHRIINQAFSYHFRSPCNSRTSQEYTSRTHCCFQKEPTHERGLPALNGVNDPRFQSRGGEYIIYDRTRTICDRI